VTWLRRTITIPVVVAVELALVALGPALLLVGALVGLAVRSSRPPRTVTLVLSYAVIELVTLGRILAAPQDWNVLLREVLDVAYRALRTIVDVRVELAPGSARPRADRQVVVLARHCGPGDSLFIVWLLVIGFGLRPLVVLKSLLRLIPLVDLAGDHLPLCFVGPRGRRSRERIARLAAAMSTGEAFLLFPEGANFTWPRWRKAIGTLTRTTQRLRAARHTHTLPPRRGGAIAALTAAPTADVLVLAHTGFTPDGRNRPWWRVPTHHTLLVHTTLIPADHVPRTPGALTGWLDRTWAQVDSWIDDHTHSGPPVDGMSDVS
jgi:hypothetical protein